mmetsp:Transcript_18234/g.20278  ORF Transcript_18234/g.20278 Transcript_18234/m.20278 type:complete len:676 (+) Transcript_18234:19-2046(+)
MSSIGISLQRLKDLLIKRTTYKHVAVGGVVVLGVVFSFLKGLGMKMTTDKDEQSKTKSKKSRRPAVNSEFFKRLYKFLPILIPGVFSKESLYMVVIAVVLSTRTFLDLWLIRNNADVVLAIQERNYPKFIQRVVYEFAVMQFFISFINNTLKYFTDNLSLSFRRNLTNHYHANYMKGFTSYSVSNLDGRTNNPDQIITQDVQKFCESLSMLYTNVTKPSFDVILFFSRLVTNFGWKGPSMMLSYFIFAGYYMTLLRTPFGKFSAKEAELEGDFRFAHSRAITYSEEIAFYKGSDKERSTLRSAFTKLYRHCGRYITFRAVLGFFDSCITKYTATILAYFIVTQPIFDPKNDARYVAALGGNPEVIIQDYTRYIRLLIALVTAVGRLVDSGRELAKLAGYTARLHDFSSVLEDVRNGKFVRSTVKTEEGDDKTEKLDVSEAKGKLVELDQTPPVIEFDQVPVVTPNGDILVRSLSFKIKAGMNCLVAGPNGCGKSSLFRILGNLWPVYSGTVTRPSGKNLFYVPQKPYLTLGTLRDQVVYPWSWEEAYENGVTQKYLHELFLIVKLDHVVEREGGWEAKQDWTDVLSGGEKQKMAMARLFLHKPQFAILDECTSAMSVDVEGDTYNHCKKLGITLFTVSHRKSLWQYHDYVIMFDGRGSVDFKNIDHSNNEDFFGS